ncbi:hypothetical protein EWM64_g1554 [Hericium alpestre]|uniref:GH18 domain-containing protein n=1 Tax=Hericium alpestre TaxID=135208 RepID=A0A4Z0A859_9AGAM|nr:hypothetical protein EWM64_g1554 [Hericium alpestre]
MALLFSLPTYLPSTLPGSWQSAPRQLATTERQHTVFSVAYKGILLADVYACPCSSAPAAAPVSTATNNDNNSHVAASWFTSWHDSNRDHPAPLANVNWTKYTHMTFSFALTTSDPNTISLDGVSGLLTDFVKAAKTNNVKALLSIGGWTGSRYFSTNVGDTNRIAFVKAITELATTYELDGIEFDGSFAKALERRHWSAVHESQWFASVLDYIEIMTYDTWGPWSPTAGPNAPLDDSCASPDQQVGSVTSAVNAWTTAGISASQIIVAVGGYGHSFSVASQDALLNGDNLATYPKFDKSKHPPGDAWNDNITTTDQCGNQQFPGSIYDMWGLVAGGFLTQNGTAADGFPYTWDSCSQTPFVYDKNSQTYVSYEDAQSFAAKGDFIKSKGLAGFNMWETGSDFNNILVDSIRSAAGFTE